VLCKEKIRKHGKKKNDKDEIGNILLKHVFALHSQRYMGKVRATNARISHLLPLRK
jgi:hypothetical protein